MYKDYIQVHRSSIWPLYHECFVCFPLASGICIQNVYNFRWLKEIVFWQCSQIIIKNENFTCCVKCWQCFITCRSGYSNFHCGHCAHWLSFEPVGPQHIQPELSHVLITCSSLLFLVAASELTSVISTLVTIYLVPRSLYQLQKYLSKGVIWVKLCKSSKALIKNRTCFVYEPKTSEALIYTCI